MTISFRIDTSGGTREILNRLHDIESLIEGQSERIAALGEPTGSVAREPDANATPDHSSVSMPNPHADAATSFTPWPLVASQDQTELPLLPPLTIPVKHRTSSSYLFSLPGMKAIIREYPTDLFFLLEARSSLQRELSLDKWPAPVPTLEISCEQADELVFAFIKNLLVSWTDGMLDADDWVIN